MDLTWIVVGLTGWALALVFVLLLMRMAGQQDRAARHSEKTLDPYSDVTITQVQLPKLPAAPRVQLAKGPPQPAESPESTETAGRKGGPPPPDRP